MKNVAIHGFVLLMPLFLAAPASAGLAAVADFTSTPAGGGNFNYTITLTDSGTTNIGTFWFSWIPGQDYMANNPTFSNPAGWTAGAGVTHGGAGDGYAIQWVSSSAPITPGHSLTFNFTSADTPAELGGASPFHGGPPEGTSFVYSGAPFSDSGFQFVVTPASASVPEPSSMILFSLTVGGFALKVWTGRRKKAAAAAA